MWDCQGSTTASYLYSSQGSGPICGSVSSSLLEQSNPSQFPQLLRDSLIHQDIVTYSQGLLAKAQSVITEASTVLDEAYEQFKNLPFNRAALAELEGNSESYDFENFSNA